MNDAKLGDFLQRIGVITPQQLHTAREVVAQHSNQPGGRGRLSSALVKMGFVTNEELARLAATALRLPYVSLDNVAIPKDLVRLLNKEEALKAKGMIVKAEGKKFFLATADPMNMIVFDELQFKLGGQIMPVVTTEDEARRTVGHYYTERIVVDRPFDLPESSTLDYGKPEVFDIKAVRAAKAKKAEQVDMSPSSDGVARKAAAQDRLAAAASAVQSKQVAQEQQQSAASPQTGDALGGMPAIRDADELQSGAEDEAPLQTDVQADVQAEVQGEVQDELEVVEVDAQEEAVAGEVIEDEEPVEGELEPIEEPAPAEPVAASEPGTNTDDLAGLFGSLLAGDAGANAAASPPASASAEETQELAKLFMGALGGESDASSTPAPKNEEADAMAKELAAMLLGE